MQEIADQANHEIEMSATDECQLVYQRALELMQSEFEEHTWRAFFETTVEGRSSVDVAEDLEMTPGAVRQAKYKVTRKLRVELADFLA